MRTARIGTWRGLWTQLKTIYPIGLEVSEVLEEAGSRAKVKTDWLVEEILSDARLAYQKRTDEIGEQLMRELERRVMLSVIDRQVARPPLRDGLPQRGHRPEGHGPT